MFVGPVDKLSTNKMMKRAERKQQNTKNVATETEPTTNILDVCDNLVDSVSLKRDYSKEE